MNYDYNETLNMGALTPSRQKLLTDALLGHSLEITMNKFTENSRSSLDKVGLTPIEIVALERSNETASPSIVTTFKIGKGKIASSDNNPFSRDDWNPEMQRELHDKDQAKAQALLREAGIIRR